MKNRNMAYVWTQERHSDDNWYTGSSFDCTIYCNGKGVFCASSPWPKEHLEALNKFQITPAEYKNGNYRLIVDPAKVKKEITNYINDLKSRQNAEYRRFQKLIDEKYVELSIAVAAAACSAARRREIIKGVKLKAKGSRYESTK